MTKDEALAMDLALEALEYFIDTSTSAMDHAMAEEAITAIKQARSAPVQDGGIGGCAMCGAAYKDQIIKATLSAFGPDEGVTFTQDTWANLHAAMSAVVAQPAVQEPVAYEYGDDVFWHDSPDINDYIRANGKALVYATPPVAQRQWVGLEREIAAAVLDHCYGHGGVSDDMIERTTEVIKAKLKELNT